MYLLDCNRLSGQSDTRPICAEGPLLIGQIMEIVLTENL